MGDDFKRRERTTTTDGGSEKQTEVNRCWQKLTLQDRGCHRLTEAGKRRRSQIEAEKGCERHTETSRGRQRRRQADDGGRERLTEAQEGRPSLPTVITPPTPTTTPRPLSCSACFRLALRLSVSDCLCQPPSAPVRQRVGRARSVTERAGAPRDRGSKSSKSH